MSKLETDEMLLRQRIAANMAHYRKLHNMTQSELAEQISYSDKSVSKWERAEGVPDIYVLTVLAGLFNVSVNDLISENAPLPPPVEVNLNKNRVIILLMSVGLAWLAATVTYTALQVFAPTLDWAWYSFIIAIPVTFIISVVFTSLWWGLKFRFAAVSALIWSVCATIYVLFPLTNVDLVFAIGAVLQVLVALWFIFMKQLKKMRRDLFSRSDGRRRA
ncbi:Helix-turn-helix [Sporobacter termitidis DSM 10068]|uniref:Helix-turn-helix n=1 Tax=Sporobacter termitidis DSM 10068 TaxID=1123282 RepID=A0A1M5YEK7_9FIRM|nr:helix-turn-helix transcriptional regulator [Sporobacter termitidis]SHI10490.1 Helix-turn-helix [Sporobacter termitidis DSM 10068]